MSCITSTKTVKDTQEWRTVKPRIMESWRSQEEDGRTIKLMSFTYIILKWFCWKFLQFFRPRDFCCALKEVFQKQKNTIGKNEENKVKSSSRRGRMRVSDSRIEPRIQFFICLFRLTINFKLKYLPTFNLCQSLFLVQEKNYISSKAKTNARNDPLWRYHSTKDMKTTRFFN